LTNGASRCHVLTCDAPQQIFRFYYVPNGKKFETGRNEKGPEDERQLKVHISRNTDETARKKYGCVVVFDFSECQSGDGNFTTGFQLNTGIHQPACELRMGRATVRKIWHICSILSKTYLDVTQFFSCSACTFFAAEFRTSPEVGDNRGITSRREFLEFQRCGELHMGPHSQNPSWRRRLVFYPVRIVSGKAAMQLDQE
jgi:hypothetical protein